MQNFILLLFLRLYIYVGWGVGVHQSSFYHCLSIIYYISDKMSASPPLYKCLSCHFLRTPHPRSLFYTSTFCISTIFSPLPLALPLCPPTTLTSVNPPPPFSHPLVHKRRTGHVLYSCDWKTHKNIQSVNCHLKNQTRNNNFILMLYFMINISSGVFLFGLVVCSSVIV